MLPIQFVDEQDYEKLENGDVLVFESVRDKIQNDNEFEIGIKGKDEKIRVKHGLTSRHLDIILEGGVINWIKNKQQESGV